MSQFDLKCYTCEKEMNECIGHYGYIRLTFPIFHIGYINDVVSILQCICKVDYILLITNYKL